jgi:hypothetical protein
MQNLLVYFLFVLCSSALFLLAHASPLGGFRYSTYRSYSSSYDLLEPVTLGKGVMAIVGFMSAGVPLYDVFKGSSSGSLTPIINVGALSAAVLCLAIFVRDKPLSYVLLATALVLPATLLCLARRSLKIRSCVACS